MEPRDLRPWLAVLALCLAVRLGHVATQDHLPTRKPYDGYQEIAANLLAGRGFNPTPLRHFYVRTPGYPLFLAAVWGLAPGPGRFLALALAQVGLSVATCGLLMATANATFGRRPALASGVLFALSPSFTFFCAQVFSETLQVFLVALAVFLAMRLFRAPDRATAVGFGLVWGVAGLTRPEATYVVPMLVAPLLFVDRLEWRTKLSYVLLIVGVNLAVLAPWVARNYRLYNGFVLHVPSSGSALFGGTYPYPPMYGRAWAPGSVYQVVWATPEYQRIVAPYRDRDYDGPPAEEVVAKDPRDFVAVDRALGRAARSFVSEHKTMFLKNLGYHFFDLWKKPAAWTYEPEPSRPFKVFWLASYFGGGLLAAAGLAAAWRTGKLSGAPTGWLAFAAAHTGLLLLICTEPRYQATSAVVLFAFAGFGGSRAEILVTTAATATLASRQSRGSTNTR